MDETIPIQFITNKFRTAIKKIQQIRRNDHARFYRAISFYGIVCLVIECYADSINGEDTLQFLELRNSIIRKNAQCFPLIYEQQILVIHPQQIICFSLIEQSRFLQASFTQISDKIRISNTDKIIRAIFILQRQMLFIKQPFIMNQLLYCPSNKQIFIDFTRITSQKLSKPIQAKQIVFCLEQLLQKRYCQQRMIKQIILIQDKIYRIDIKKLRQANDILELMVMLNILSQLSVQIQVKLGAQHKKNNKAGLQNLNCQTKAKIVQIKQLEGIHNFKYCSKQYKLINFVEGKCINSLSQIQYDELKQKFIKKNARYCLRKQQHLFVQIEEGDNNQNISEDLITVNWPVAKIELISFLICYIKWIDPIIYSIVYIEIDNSLQIDFVNKLNQSKQFKIKFYSNYIIKDEQISMILERAKVKNCKLDLRYMRINDSLLMFLANSQKLSKINQLCLSDCHGLSEHGISVLLISPFCKNLHSLTLLFEDCLLASSIESLGIKSDIQHLFLKRNQKSQQMEYGKYETVDVSKMKLISLVSQGIKINISNMQTNTLKILKITQFVSSDEFKHLKNLQLIELRIKIMETGKKNIIESTSSMISGVIIGKHNNIKAFAEGPSSKTLKVLDISQSNVKFKSVKCLLQMGELQKVVMDSMINLGSEYEPISPKITRVSLAYVNMSIEQLSILLHKTPILAELNIIGNLSITRNQLLKFIADKKKLISQLFLSEDAYTNKLIQKLTQSNAITNLQLVENVCLFVDNLLQAEQEHVLFFILKKVSKTPKSLRMLTHYPQDKQPQTQSTILSHKQKQLVQKINKFMSMNNKKMNQFKNLFINRYSYGQISQIYRNMSKSNFDQISNNLFWNLNKKNKIVSTPKLQISQNQIICFNVMPNETIDKIAHRFIRLYENYIDKTKAKINFNMADNKLIQSHIIKLLFDYAAENIITINFINCIFSFQQVIDLLFEFPLLQQTNEGKYSMKMNRHNFISRSQNYLKFFMRIKRVEALQIDCYDVQQIQILYSVLYHILDRHTKSLQILRIKFHTLIINEESDMFIQKLFNLQDLNQLQLCIQDCRIRGKKAQIKNWQQGINRLISLKILKLRLPSFNFPQINLKHLQQLQVGFSDVYANQQGMHKIIKNIIGAPIKRFSLDLSFNQQINHLGKIFGINSMSSILEKLQKMQIFAISVQHCHLREQSILQTIYAISKCQSIKQIELNLSFCVTNFKQLEHAVQHLPVALGRPLKITIIAVNETSNKFGPQQEINLQNGIEFIL